MMSFNRPLTEPPGPLYAGSRRESHNNKNNTAMLKKILLNAAAALMLIAAGLALGWSFTVGTCNF
jgi:hypothetical protein